MKLDHFNTFFFDFQCFVRCIFKKEGFWNEADVPQIDYIVESLQHSVSVKRKKLKKMIKKCAERKFENSCETAFQVTSKLSPIIIWKLDNYLQFLECYLNDKLVVKAQPYENSEPVESTTEQTESTTEQTESLTEPKTEL